MKIINPITGKSHSVKSKAGRQILKKYIQSYTNGGSYSGQKNIYERQDKLLLHAVKNGYEDVLFSQLKKERRVDKLLRRVKDKDGNTLLHWAAKRGHVNIVKFLLDMGAEKDVNNINGRMPIHLAENYGHTEIVSLLTPESVPEPALDADGFDTTPLDIPDFN